MQSLGALLHYDFNQAGAYSYEQAIQAIRRLGLPVEILVVAVGVPAILLFWPL